MPIELKERNTAERVSTSTIVQAQPSTCARAFKLFLWLALPAFALMVGSIYMNEWLGPTLHMSLTLSAPSPFVFESASYSLRWYGIFLLAGFLAASLTAASQSKKWNLTEDEALGLALWALFGGALGARLYYVLICLPYFIAHPSLILAISDGGLTIHGCMIGVVTSILIFSKMKHLRFLSIVDMAACVLPLAQAFWRAGNFFNSEAFGKPIATSSLVNLFIAPEYRPPFFKESQYFHPAFLYELLWDAALFVILNFFVSKHARAYPGLLTALYITGYSCGRLIVEWVRVDGISYGFVSVPVVVSELCILAGAIWTMRLLKKYKNA